VLASRPLSLLLPLLAVELTGGCAPRRQTAPASIVQKDDLGRTVQLAAPARRIASLSPSNTELLFAVGCSDRVVLRDRASSYPAGAQRLASVNALQLSAEHLAGYQPDLVLLSHVDVGRLQALQAAGLQVASFDPRSLEALYANLQAVGALCGAGARAEQLRAELRRREAAVAAAVSGRRRPTVYIEIDGSNPQRPWVAGPGSFVDHLVSVAGGRNFVARLSRAVAPINAEEVLTARPEVILLANVEGDRRSGGERLRQRPGWGQLPAVQQGRVIDTIHRDLLSRPGPRALDGLEALAAALHPDAFSPSSRPHP
jgi:iron complex transport system substrate-binding protein